MSQPLSKDELEKMFHDYARRRASILKDETQTGKRATMHRRMANAVLSYAKEYTEAFPAVLSSTVSTNAAKC